METLDYQPLDDIVAASCAELFVAYQLDMRPCGRERFPATEELALCGVMGFGGKRIRGALLLATTREPLERTNPGSVHSQRDWICELSNQLMGRIKNKLLLRGVEVLLATPVGLSGENLCATPTKLRAPHVFAAENGYVCVWIDLEFTDGYAIPHEALWGAETPVTEGDTILF